jgi:N-acyl-L-homoserine lactone synthetase
LDLAQADERAAKLVAMAAPIEVRVAREAAEVEASFRLRYQAIIERGWMRPEDFPNGLECDHFDKDALHIVAWAGERAIGTARVVLPRAGRLLPTEEAYDVIVEPQGRVVDWGRNVVSRDYTGPRYQLFGALLGQSWIETRAHGFDQVCGNASAAVIRLYRLAVKVVVTPIGPSRMYWGEKRFPFVLTSAYLPITE